MRRHRLFSFSTLLIAATLAWGVPAPASAQIGRLLKNTLRNSAEHAAEVAINRALERLIEREIDKLFDRANKSYEVRGDTIVVRDSVAGTQTILVSSEPPADPEPSPFVGTFELEMESYKKDKLEKGFPTTMTYHIDEYAMAIEMGGDQETILIIDRKERTMTTKIKDKKDKRAVVMPLRSYTIKSDNQLFDYELTETGATKTVNGYDCAEYIVESEQDISHVWVTRAIELDLSQMFDFLNFQNSQNNPVNAWKEVEGAPVRSETQMKGKDIRTVTNLKSYKAGKVSSSPFSLKGYEVQEMPSFYSSRTINPSEGDSED